ncbi:MAG: hypothetical protein AAGA92_08845 [Planctomycetota bacterium]
MRNLARNPVRRRAATAAFAAGLFCLLPQPCVAEESADQRQQRLQVDAVAWIKQAGLDPAKEREAVEPWRELPDAAGPEELLAAFARSASRLYPNLASQVTRYTDPAAAPTPRDTQPMSWELYPRFAAANLALLRGRWQARAGLYEAAAASLEGLSADEVLDPVGLLFYRAVSLHQLVRPDESRAALVELLDRPEPMPSRYRDVAELMAKDLRGVEDESLDHVARRMRDIRRRLGLGHAGERVQTVERGVVESLDRIIKKKEDEQNGGGGSSGSSGGVIRPGQPMQDSQPAELKAPGKVDPKDIGNTPGWGDLPPKEREQAMQQIGRDFPAHYQALIEEYFRDLAADPDASADQP